MVILAKEKIPRKRIITEFQGNNSRRDETETNVEKNFGKRKKKNRDREKEIGRREELRGNRWEMYDEKKKSDKIGREPGEKTG